MTFSITPMTRPSWTTHSHAFAGCIQSGTGFPDGWGFGKCVPEFAFGMGCGFRLRALVENATRNLQSEWDAVSQRGRKRKLHPTPDVNSGTRFPDAKKATRRGLQLIYVADTPMTSRAPTTGRLSRRRHIRFIASSARKEGRKFDAGLLTLLDVVDAKPAQKLYRYRKVPGRRGRI